MRDGKVQGDCVQDVNAQRPKSESPTKCGAFEERSQIVEEEDCFWEMRHVRKSVTPGEDVYFSTERKMGEKPFCVECVGRYSDAKEERKEEKNKERPVGSGFENRVQASILCTRVPGGLR